MDDQQTQQTEWSVEFYTDARGRSPVRDFIQGLPGREQAAILRVTDLLEELGLALGMPYARPIEGLWELRAGAGRLFYFAYTGRRFIILHGYRKKGQKAPRREIATAKRRRAEFLEREDGR